MDERAVRSYLERPWDELSALKLRYTAQRFAREGHEPSLRIARALRERYHRIRPDAPTVQDRRLDLASHLAFKALIDRVTDDFS